MNKIDCFNCHGTCGCHKKGNKSMIGCTCPFNGLMKIVMTKGCPWCLEQIREDKYNDHLK